MLSMDVCLSYGNVMDSCLPTSMVSGSGRSQEDYVEQDRNHFVHSNYLYCFLWLFQFPSAVSLIKSSFPNALHFEFLLFLAVLLVLVWNCWKGSASTNCSKWQCDIHEHPPGNGRQHMRQEHGFPLGESGIWIW